ncbi:hypothetical protein LZ30DRAFT_666508 [Colletotrichum cereale]|nr:hypothetical protein LZ30DRAFT_666508 [Colletotrichum cereale]
MGFGNRFGTDTPDSGCCRRRWDRREHWGGPRDAQFVCASLWYASPGSSWDCCKLESRWPLLLSRILVVCSGCVTVTWRTIAGIASREMTLSHGRNGVYSTTLDTDESRVVGGRHHGGLGQSTSDG